MSHHQQHSLHQNGVTPEKQLDGINLVNDQPNRQNASQSKNLRNSSRQKEPIFTPVKDQTTQQQQQQQQQQQYQVTQQPPVITNIVPNQPTSLHTSVNNQVIQPTYQSIIHQIPSHSQLVQPQVVSQQPIIHQVQQIPQQRVITKPSQRVPSPPPAVVHQAPPVQIVQPPVQITQPTEIQVIPSSPPGIPHVNHHHPPTVVPSQHTNREDIDNVELIRTQSNRIQHLEDRIQVITTEFKRQKADLDFKQKEVESWQQGYEQLQNQLNLHMERVREQDRTIEEMKKDNEQLILACDTREKELKGIQHQLKHKNNDAEFWREKSNEQADNEQVILKQENQIRVLELEVERLKIGQQQQPQPQVIQSPPLPHHHHHPAQPIRHESPPRQQIHLQQSNVVVQTPHSPQLLKYHQQQLQQQQKPSPQLHHHHHQPPPPPPMHHHHQLPPQHPPHHHQHPLDLAGQQNLRYSTDFGHPHGHQYNQHGYDQHHQHQQPVGYTAYPGTSSQLDEGYNRQHRYY